MRTATYAVDRGECGRVSYVAVLIASASEAVAVPMCSFATSRRGR